MQKSSDANTPDAVEETLTAPTVPSGNRSGSAGKPRARSGGHHSRATMQDVARRAGVTKGTVSKYLNAGAGYYVAAETRARIEAAIRELDFEPNAIAQGLTQNRTMTIGLVAADIRNPFYPDLVAGVQRIVEPAGYTLVLGSSGSDPERERAIVRSMLRRQVDGVILSSARMRESELESLIQSGVRVVLASRNLLELVTDTVVTDNRAGGQLAVEHLARLGHRRIAHIAGPQDVVPFRDRLEGFRLGMQAHGLDVDESLIQEVSSSFAGGADVAERIFSHSPMPTAIFVANDNIALRVMDVARKHALRIPEDVSIVGFDNIALAENSFIALTTIDSQAGLLGEDAATMLLDRLRAGDIPPYQDIHNVAHPPILRTRGTTSSPNSDVF